MKHRKVYKFSKKINGQKTEMLNDSSIQQQQNTRKWLTPYFLQARPDNISCTKQNMHITDIVPAWYWIRSIDLLSFCVYMYVCIYREIGRESECIYTIYPTEERYHAYTFLVFMFVAVYIFSIVVSAYVGAVCVCVCSYLAHTLSENPSDPPQAVIHIRHYVHIASEPAEERREENVSVNSAPKPPSFKARNGFTHRR